jgi:pilus assembly protein TadC
MVKITDLTLPSLLKSYKQNESSILIYIEKKKGNIIEGLSDENDKMTVGAFKGITVIVFLVFLLLSIGLSIWALIVLIKNSDNMPVWAIVLSWVFFVISGPVIPLILVYSTKGTK